MMEQPTNRDILDAITGYKTSTDTKLGDLRDTITGYQTSTETQLGDLRDTITGYQTSTETQLGDLRDALLDFKSAAENGFIRIDKHFTEVDRRFDGLVAQMNR